LEIPPFLAIHLDIRCRSLLLAFCFLVYSLVVIYDFLVVCIQRWGKGNIGKRLHGRSGKGESGEEKWFLVYWR